MYDKDLKLWVGEEPPKTTKRVWDEATGTFTEVPIQPEKAKAKKKKVKK